MIQPIQNRVIVKREERKEKTKGGIIIPDSAKKNENEGVVIAVGPGSYSSDGLVLVPVGVAAGDRIVFEKRATYEEIEVDGEKCIVLREHDIIGIIGFH